MARKRTCDAQAVNTPLVCRRALNGARTWRTPFGGLRKTCATRMNYPSLTSALLLVTALNIWQFALSISDFISPPMASFFLSSDRTAQSSENQQLRTDLATLMSVRGQLPRERVEFLVQAAEDRLNALRRPLLRFSSPHPKQNIPWMTIVGDLHGQLFDLLYIIESEGPPSAAAPYVFLGDLVDRGPFGLEILLILLIYQLIDPSSVYFLRGNREMRTRYNFRKQVVDAYDETIYDACLRLFDLFPVAAVVHDDLFLVHGGLPINSKTLSDIESLRLGNASLQQNLLKQLIWNDPILNSSISGNLRGRTRDTFQFGQDVTERFLNDNNLSLVIRSHEMTKYGFELIHQKRLVTLFSAPNVLGLGNLGAHMRISTDLSYHVVMFQQNNKTTLATTAT